MSTKAAGIKDVAAAAGVSITTVSQVLNNVAYARVGAETRDRVHEAARRLGYGPNRLAQALRTRRSGVIGMICESFAAASDTGSVILGSEEAARRRGYNIMVITSAGTDSEEVRESGVAALLDRRVDGIVYAATDRGPLRLPAGLAGVPAVLVDAADTGRSVPSVVLGREAGARTAVQYLVDAGHTRIGMVTTIDDVPATDFRLRAFKDTLTHAGLEFRAELVQSGRPDAAGGHQAALRLLQLEDPPTAVFCFNDPMAMGLYRAASELGVRIPDDLSVVGFGNQEPIAENLDPALTTVRLPHHAMGAWATEHLIDAIEGDASARVLAVEPAVLDCALVIRESVALPR
ncbi:LacI family transcriptional regulator [Arthrobacter sp. PvP023]|uniref:LacI family DNA-binding transcriptional regulator n=1 Tax=Micrococcaceae TaxID=1268 RepID=UPI001AEA25E8|nr:LacI family DNA-binding transcriptional regulator [Arthrobacter sp. PvP023]MBP1134013.1 LacI family transcriptional regulator [Arthrobacter sp. PvP023]